MQVKQALDELFEGVDFDTRLYNKLLINNTEYISRNQDHTRLFSGRNIGCYYIKYTMYDKNIFYNNVFNMEYDDVTDVVDKIKSIPNSFKIAKDDINLVCFYVAHRFLSNKELSDKQREEYAREALNYFSYRTLVLISSNYFVYPISEAKATSLTERLSGKYLIKQLKNWNEYCKYRSEEYLESKFKKMIIAFRDDKELPNAISDLYGRTKDTLKNIYSEFMVMLEKDEITANRKSILTDAEGSDTIADRIENVSKYIGKVDAILTDKHSFIRNNHMAAVVDMLKGLSFDMLEESLVVMLNYSTHSRENYNRVSKFLKDILINAVEYLQRNELTLSSKTDVVGIINSLVGNVLYARGNSATLNDLKEEGYKLVHDTFKHSKKSITGRNAGSVRNGIYLYIVLLAIVE